MDHCQLHLDPEENKLVFIFHCRHGREEREGGGREGGEGEREREMSGGGREGEREVRRDVMVGQYSLLKQMSVACYVPLHLQALLRRTNWATRSVCLCKLCSTRTSPPITLQDLQGTEVT